MNGTPKQIEWANEIRVRIDGEFDRVANLLRAKARGQSSADRMDTLEVVSLLEDLRVEVLSQDKAGYFIREWQEVDGRVRLLILGHPRYLSIQSRRMARHVGAAQSLYKRPRAHEIP